jgi:hypothetical protein
VGRARELTGKPGGVVAQLILDGYLTFQTVAIRRLCDRRRDVISLRRVLTEAKAQNIATHDQINHLSDKLDSCDHVYDLVSDHIAHTADLYGGPTSVRGTCRRRIYSKLKEQSAVLPLRLISIS